MQKLKVAVFFGSRSTEHDISILTALASVIKPLQLSGKYQVIPVYIAKDGQWYSHPRLADISLYQSGGLGDFLARQKPLLAKMGGGLTLVWPGLRNKIVKVDVAFPALHGSHGEDGELMGVFEMAGVPYVGCDLPSSALAMDKVLAKQVAAACGIDTAAYVAFRKTEYQSAPEKWQAQANKLRYPLFVKPAHIGSSIGISRVTDKAELANAIEVALHFDDRVVVEEAVRNLVEVTLPVMGNENLTPAFLEEPLLKSEDFFDFDTKYMQGGKGKGKGGAKNGAQEGAQGYSRIPADLPKELYTKAEQTGVAVFRALGCAGFARIDMLIDRKTKTVYFNEVNPMPGSLYAHNWAKKGISNVELVTRLIALALERWQRQQQFATTFDTNYLQQF